MKTAAKEWELAGMHNETDLDKSSAAIRMVQMRLNEDQRGCDPGKEETEGE